MYSEISSRENVGEPVSGPIEVISKLRRYSPQLIAVAVKNISLLIYGLSVGIKTMIVPKVKGDIVGETIVMDEEEISWLGSVNYLCVPIGCLLSGKFTRVIGRIRSIQVVCVLFFAAFLLYHYATQSWQLFLALSITGVSGGLLEAPALVYTSEVTETSIRGAACSTATLSISIGLLISFIIGSMHTWREMALIISFIPLAGFMMMWFIPESPHWLITKNRMEDARRSLAWLRGWTQVTNIEQEFKSIADKLAEQRDEHSGLAVVNINRYFKTTFLKPFLLIFFAFILADFGTTQINIYAVSIFETLRVPIDSYSATIIIGVIELFSSILLMFLVRFLGKRKMMFISQTGVFISFLLLGLYTYKISATKLDPSIKINEELAEKYSWVPLVTINSVVFFSYLMTYALPWILIGEMFPKEIKDSASGLSAGTGYILTFVANYTILKMVNAVTLAGTFWIYGITAGIGGIAMYFILPETEGKSLLEITDHYEGRSMLSNKVRRSESMEMVSHL